jgi:hypothetical protein
MSDDRDDPVIRLLNEELDGELDMAGRVELDALLATDPGLAARRDALHTLDCTLRAVVDAEQPPPDLAQRIARGIELPPQPRLLDRLMAAWRRPLWVPAATFALGLGVAMALYPALEGSLDGVEATRMTGTLISERTPAGLIPHARLALALEELQGEVTLADAAAGESLLEFQLAARGAVSVAIELGGSGLDYVAPPSADGVQVLEREGDRMTLRSERPGYFALALRGEGATGGTVKVEFSMDGRSLGAGVLAAR